MLATLRKYIKTVAVVLLFGLLIIAFAMWNGMSDTFAPSANSSVLKAGDREMSSAEFERILKAQLPGLEQRAQRQITMQEVAKANFDQQLLQQLAGQESLGALVSRVGLKPGAQLIAERLRETPEFFDPLTGKFDRKSYVDRLAQIGMTTKENERGLGDEIAARHFEAGMTAGLTAPRAYGALQAAFAKNNRSVSYFFLDAGKVAPPAQPTEAQLTALMNEFADRLRDPESRQLTIVRFSARDMASSVTLDQAELQKLYDFRKQQESTPETRTVVQVTAKDAAGAQAAAARLAKGEDAAAVAKAVGGVLVTYDGKPKTAIPDRKVADAAFSLPAGQASAPIKGELTNFAVVRVLAITPGKTPDLASMRTKLEAEARQNAAEQKATEAADKFQEFHDAGATLADAAAKAGGKVFVTPPVTASGAPPRGGKPAEGLSEKLMQTAFRLSGGAESEIESDTRGEYYVVKVEKIIPPALPAMDATFRGVLTEGWKQRDVANRMKAKADELAARVRKGESLEAVAASIGATVQKAGPIDRTNAEGFQRLGDTINTAVLGKKGEVTVGVAGPADPKAPPKPELVILRVDATGVAPASELAQLTAQTRRQANQMLTRDMYEQLSQGARTVIKPKTYPERARRALNVDVPLEDPNAKGKTKAGELPKDGKG